MRTRARSDILASVLALAAAAGGCGGGGETTGDAGVDAAAGFQPASHLPLPQIPDQGGRVLDHVDLVTVTFAGYAYQNELEAFGDWVVESEWLAAVGAEYGVGTGTHLAKVVIPEAPPPVVTYDDVVELLEEGMDSGALPSPESPADPTMFLVYYPASTRVDAPGFTGCQTGGFHASFEHDGAQVAFAPIPDCSAANPFGWGAVESIEENASHELIEAITDPDYLEPAWLLDDPADPWSAFYGEVADFCVGNIVQESGHTASRIWSNAAAAAGADPCQPSTGVYASVSAATPTIRVPSGEPASFPLTGWSSAERDPWSLLVVPGWITGFDPAPALSATTVANGGSVDLTVLVPPGTPAGARGSIFVYSYDQLTGPYAFDAVGLLVE